MEQNKDCKQAKAVVAAPYYPELTHDASALTEKIYGRGAVKRKKTIRRITAGALSAVFLASVVVPVVFVCLSPSFQEKRDSVSSGEIDDGAQIQESADAASYAMNGIAGRYFRSSAAQTESFATTYSEESGELIYAYQQCIFTDGESYDLVELYLVFSENDFRTPTIYQSCDEAVTAGDVTISYFNGEKDGIYCKFSEGEVNYLMRIVTDGQISAEEIIVYYVGLLFA